MPMYAVKISLTVLVMAESSETAIEIARDAENQILDETVEMEYEFIDQVRSIERAEGFGWPSYALPYGDDMERSIADLVQEGKL